MEKGSAEAATTVLRKLFRRKACTLEIGAQNWWCRIFQETQATLTALQRFKKIYHTGN